MLQNIPIYNTIVYTSYYYVYIYYILYTNTTVVSLFSLALYR